MSSIVDQQGKCQEPRESCSAFARLIVRFCVRLAWTTVRCSGNLAPHGHHPEAASGPVRARQGMHVLHERAGLNRACALTPRGYFFSFGPGPAGTCSIGRWRRTRWQRTPLRLLRPNKPASTSSWPACVHPSTRTVRKDGRVTCLAPKQGLAGSAPSYAQRAGPQRGADGGHRALAARAHREYASTYFSGNLVCKRLPTSIFAL